MVLGIAMGLLASASWAAANVFVQRSGRRVGPFRALVWAQVAGILSLLPFMLLLDRPVAGAWRQGATLAWAALAGVAAVLAYGCLFFSSERGRLSVVAPIMSSWSVIAAAISLGFMGETLRPAHWIGAGLVATGVLIVSRFSRAPGGDEASTHAGAAARRRERGALWGAVGTALGFGVLIPAIRRLTPATGQLGVIPAVFVLDLALGVPLALAAGIELRPPPWRAWPVVAAAGLLETLGFVWLGIGVAHAPVAVVSPLAGLSSAFTVLFAWLVLRERPPTAVLLGAGVACAGVIVLSR